MIRLGIQRKHSGVHLRCQCNGSPVIFHHRMIDRVLNPLPVTIMFSSPLLPSIRQKVDAVGQSVIEQGSLCRPEVVLARGKGGFLFFGFAGVSDAGSSDLPCGLTGPCPLRFGLAPWHSGSLARSPWLDMVGHDWSPWLSYVW